MREEDTLEFIGQIIDIFEDFLHEKGINIPNGDRDNDTDLDDESTAIIYGNDYFILEDKLKETMVNWGVLENKSESICDISNEIYKLIEVKEELMSAISEGFIELDAKNPDNIMVYRNASKTLPAGWYSERISDIASELVYDEQQYKEFKATLEEARKENSYES